MKKGKDGARIKIIKNGPYMVLGNVSLGKEEIVPDEKDYLLVWKKISDYPHREKYELCRCGESKHAPFCDGTHHKIKFECEETSGNILFKKEAQVSEGASLKLLDMEKLCANGHFCTRDRGIWDLVENSAGPESDKIAISEGMNCPAGRLVLVDKKTGKEIEPDFAPAISAVEDSIKGVSGPLWVKGRIPIEAPDGTLYELRNRVTLCRCGHSTNKPFCDSIHVEIDFHAEENK